MTKLGADYREADSITTRRYLRQKPGVGFLPWGLLPLLLFGLLLLFAWLSFAKGAVENRAEMGARVALDAAGEDWAKVDASGQWVTITGSAPSVERGARALTLVRDVKSRTPFGSARPVTRVNDKILYPASEGDQPGVVSDQVVSGPLSPDWRFEIEDETLVLSGQIVGEETKTVLLDEARRVLPTAGFSAIRDDLTVISGEADPGHLDMLLRGAGAISYCKHGFAAFQYQNFDLDCDLAAVGEADFDRLMATPLPLGTLGNQDIRRERSVEACDARFARVLSGTKFEFESGSAAIGTENDRLLDMLVGAIETCAGGLVVEGHTDSTGAPPVNLGLSQARAEVVRMALVERGLTPDNIRAIGYGSGRPIGDNSTPEGRAQNRRIEIRMRP